MKMRLEQREKSSPWLNLTLPLVAIAATLVLCGGLIALAGANVIEAYTVLFASALDSKFNLVETLVKAAPLVLTGLAVAVAFRAKFWNIGAEGQFLLGAMAAVYVGTQEALPTWSLVPLMIVCGMLAGGLWAVLPAILKTRFKVDDVVTTLLLNFIIFYAMMALLDGPWKDPLSGYPDSPDILMDAEFPILLRATRLHLGVLLAAVAAVSVWWMMRFTTLGFAIRAVGENPRAAAYAGHNITRVVILTALISGGLAGLAGVGEAAGLHFQVMAGISTGYGYTGIVIAMLARLNPLGVVPSAIFFAIRAVGENPRAAAYAGHNITRVVILTALISGGLAGLAGVGEAAGLHFQVMAGISTGYGYTGIVIAMLARLNPLGVVPSAIFFSIIITGAEAMSRATGVPVFLADVIQGTALMTMLIALLFTSYRLRVSLSDG
jgi:simple sugar transport system permease protein